MARQQLGARGHPRVGREQGVRAGITEFELHEIAVAPSEAVAGMQPDMQHLAEIDALEQGGLAAVADDPMQLGVRGTGVENGNRALLA